MKIKFTSMWGPNRLPKMRNVGIFTQSYGGELSWNREGFHNILQQLDYTCIICLRFEIKALLYDWSRAEEYLEHNLKECDQM